MTSWANANIDFSNSRGHSDLWVIKLAATTTLGETEGDTVTMTMNWGYLAGTIPFLGILVVLVIAQNRRYPIA
jgi:uncharacterized membrane-anchored protein